VSPSWLEPVARLARRERREILLAPYRVEFLCRRNGQPAEHLVLECEDGEDGGAAFALRNLNAGLERLAWRASTVQVRLSNHFVRYALVPGLAKLRGREERLLAARHQLQAVYGERAQRWQVAVDEARGAPNAVAAGTDQELLQSIVDALARAELDVDTVEPLLAAAFNRLRKAFGKSPTWLCIAEPGRITLAYAEHGQWRFVMSERQRGELETALPPLLERARLANGVPAGRVFLVADTPLNAAAQASGWQFEWHPLGTAAANGTLQ